MSRAENHYVRMADLAEITALAARRELRDRFARAALPAVIDRAPHNTSHGEVASVAFDIADAMLAEREKRT